MTNVQIAVKTIVLHEVFGLSEPIPGLPVELEIPATRSPYCPAINPFFVFTGDLVARVFRSYAARENIMLVGEKGTGKSSFVQQFCARLNLPLMVINGGPGLDETYLMGSKTLEDGTVKAVDGVLSYCVRHGIPVLIDEIASIKPGVLVSINDVLNGDQVITLKHHGLDPTVTPDQLALLEGNMTIKRSPQFRLFATDNTGGKVSKDARYNGVQTQNSAVRSRWTTFKVGFMKPALELKALMGATDNKLELTVAKQLVEFAIRARASFEMGELYDTVSFRELQRWGRKALVYGEWSDTLTDADDNPVWMADLDTAFVDAVYTAMEETDQAVIANIYELVIGTALTLPEEYSDTASKFLTDLENAELDWGDLDAVDDVDMAA